MGEPPSTEGGSPDRVTATIRSIDAHLWEEFRVECVRRRISLGRLLNEMLRERYQRKK